MENTKLKVNQMAPDFCILDANNKSVCLKDFRGKWIVLYFYPKDDTPGCTTEAIDFSALREDFIKYNAVVLGISKDSCGSHQKFINKHSLTVMLLSDVDTKVQATYGVWRKKKFMGKEFLGTVRTTILIDPKGYIKKIWDKVQVKGHAKEVLEELKNA